jgi:hypothetical protein
MAVASIGEKHGMEHSQILVGHAMELARVG